MRIAITGATGFLGRYIVRHLASLGHRCRCWHRPGSDRSGFGEAAGAIEWVAGSLDQTDSFDEYCRGADAVVHSALHRPVGMGFRAAGADDFNAFIRINLLGSLALMHAAREVDVPRFVFISTCAVHDEILQDRPLDEAHPLWSKTHYGAHKAAVEKFVHSFGLGEGWPVCSLRPTGIYGLTHPPAHSRWFGIVQRNCEGRSFRGELGGKEVHAADVARAVAVLLDADDEAIRGQAFNCYDLYVAEKTVAELARRITGSDVEILGTARSPQNQIDTSKITKLGMTFGGEPLLQETIEQLIEAARA
jgi:nucleoside-diphosphate-sugar epimerase